MRYTAKHELQRHSFCCQQCQQSSRCPHSICNSDMIKARHRACRRAECGDAARCGWPTARLRCGHFPMLPSDGSCGRRPPQTSNTPSLRASSSARGAALSSTCRCCRSNRWCMCAYVAAPMMTLLACRSQPYATDHDAAPHFRCARLLRRLSAWSSCRCPLHRCFLCLFTMTLCPVSLQRRTMPSCTCRRPSPAMLCGSVMERPCTRG